MITFIQESKGICRVEIREGFFDNFPNSIPYSYGSVRITIVKRGEICVSRILDDDYGAVIINGNIILESSPIIEKINLRYSFTIQQEILDV